MRLSILEETYKSYFVVITGVILIDNKDIGVTICKEISSLKSWKKILPNNFIACSNHFFRLNSTPRGVYLDNTSFDDETCNLGSLDEPCDTPSILSKLKFKTFNSLVIGQVNVKS